MTTTKTKKIYVPLLPKQPIRLSDRQLNKIVKKVSGGVEQTIREQNNGN